METLQMVEEFLKKNRDRPIKVSELIEHLPEQVRHPTLKKILAQLEEDGKIIDSSKGIQWIYAKPKRLKRMRRGGLEV